MIAVTEIVSIEPEQEVKCYDGNTRRLKQVWVKSADSDAQGEWTTFLKLWDEKIDQFRDSGAKEGDTLSVSIVPSSRRLSNGTCVQSVYIKLVEVA